MNSIPKTRKRHFPYKSPTFGTKNIPKSKSAWECSVYYWWWAYLKRNKDYLACCERNGKGRLANLYKDFGDVRGDIFKDWWQFKVDGLERGAYLFSEPPVDEIVRVMDEGELVPNKAEMLTVTLPLNFPKKLLEKRFKSLLAENHKGQRGRQLAKIVKPEGKSARYLFTGQPNIQGLKQALQVYDYRQEHSDLKLWELGNLIPRFQLANKTNKNDINFTDKSNRMAATVGRYLKRVEDRLERLSLGVFP